MNLLQKRLRSEEGFTLIELLVVMIIIGILVAIAVPSYLAFRGTAQDTAGKADVRAAVPDAEEYFAQNNVYTGMDQTSLLALDSGLSQGRSRSTVISASHYCLSASGQAGKSLVLLGPGWRGRRWSDLGQGGGDGLLVTPASRRG